MKYILANAFREYRIRLTNPVLPLWDVVVPVVYLLVFGASLESWLDAEAVSMNYPAFFLAGVLAMVTFSIAMNSSYAFFEDLQSGIFHELLTYPFPRRDLLLGKLLFNALFGVVGAALCIVAAATVLKVRISFMSLAPLALWIVLGTAGWYFLLSVLSLRVRGFNAYHTMSSSLYLLLMFASNLFYPVERLPAWIRWLAWINPVTWQVDLLRYYTYGQGEPLRLQLEAAGYTSFVLATFWLANHSLNSSVE